MGPVGGNHHRAGRGDHVAVLLVLEPEPDRTRRHDQATPDPGCHAVGGQQPGRDRGLGENRGRPHQFETGRQLGGCLTSGVVLGGAGSPTIGRGARFAWRHRCSRSSQVSATFGRRPNSSRPRPAAGAPSRRTSFRLADWMSRIKSSLGDVWPKAKLKPPSAGGRGAVPPYLVSLGGLDVQDQVKSRRRLAEGQTRVGGRRPAVPSHSRPARG